MAEIRLLRPDELQEAVLLADATFRDNEQSSMGTAFPSIFAAEMPHSYGAFADGKLVSFMGLVPSVLRIGRARLAVFSLGAVCTDPAYRGRGIASETLRQVIRYADEGCASLLLISGGRSLYTKAGCFPFGAAERYIVTPDSIAASGAAGSGAGRYREAQPADWHALHELAAKRGVRYEQSISDLMRLVRAEALASCMKLRHKVVVAERNGAPAAFAVVGVPARAGQKHAPLVLEWAGNPRLAAGLFAHAVNEYALERLIVPVPWHETGIAASTAPLAAEREREERSHTMKIINPARLLRQLDPYLQNRNASACTDLAARADKENRWQLQAAGHTAELTAAGIASVLFDPQPNASLDGDTAKAWSALFPIPLPFNRGLNYV